MTTRSWLTRLFAPRTVRTVRRPRCRPALEPLENRWLPAITVNTLVDQSDGSITDGTISLRDAIAASPPGGVINFSVHGTINLALGTVVLHDVDLEGPGASQLTINAHGGSQVFSTSGTTTIAGVTIIGGQAGPGDGGGISNGCEGSNALLTVADSVIAGNSATNGGGIYSTDNGAFPYLDAEVTVVNSTISGNYSVDSGGGVYGAYSLFTIDKSTISYNSNLRAFNATASAIGGATSTVWITNSTVSHNSGNGAAIFAGSGVIANSTIVDDGDAIEWASGTVTNSTITGNTIGIYSPQIPSTSLNNSIVEGNMYDIYGVVDSGGRNNLIGKNGAGGLANGVNGNIVGVVDPGIGPLADNGGPTQTCALFNYSPAVNAGDNALIPTDPVSGLPLTTDQCGAPRVFGGAVDIGAVELQGTVVPSTVVNTTTDDVAPDGLTSLRAAVAFAGRLGGAVTFDPAVFATPQTLTLTRGPILVQGNAGPVTISGPGAGLATVDAAGASSDFLIISTATVSGLTISGGGGGDLGAIANDDPVGTLSILDCVISGNSNSGVVTEGPLNIDDSIISGNTGEAGGGVYSVFGVSNVVPDANVNISNSTITGNSATGLPTAGAGAGIFSRAPLSIVNSTISDNSTRSFGGGIDSLSTLTLYDSTVSGNSADNESAMLLDGSSTIINSTIANNTSNQFCCIGVDVSVTIMSSTVANNTCINSGAAIAGSNITLLSSIVAANRANGMPADLLGTVSSTSAYNLIGDAATAGGLVTGVNGNIVGVDPLLGPLADNGGPTQTQALLVGSPALNAGVNPFGLAYDQRGALRSIGSAPDIGAYEYQPITVANVQVNDGSAQRSEVRSLTVTFSGPVAFAGGNAAAAFQLEHIQDATDINNLAAAVSTNGSGDTVVTLTFTTTGNASTEIDPVSAENGGAPSLADGRYQLTALSSAVSDAALGWALDGDGDGAPGGTYVSPADTQGGGPGQLHLYRLFGDANGDGIDDQLDLATFRAANNSSSPDPAYVAFLDADNSGTIDQFDLGQFRGRNNSSVFPTGPVVTSGGGGRQSPSATPAVWPTPFGVPDTLPAGSPVPIAAPTAVPSIVVNDGSSQWSEIRSVRVAFFGPMTFAGGMDYAAAAFQLAYLTNGNDASPAAAVSADSQGTVVTPTVSGAETDPLSGENGGTSTPGDGRHQLAILSGSVTATNGVALNGGGPNRLFGDATRDGIVDQSDLGLFRGALNTRVGDLSYLSFLDADNSGVVDLADFGQF